MHKYIISCLCVSSVCFGAEPPVPVEPSRTPPPVRPSTPSVRPSTPPLPCIFKRSINDDLTISYPECYNNNDLINEYLGKAEKYINKIKKSESLTLQNANDATNYRTILDMKTAVDTALQILENIISRIVRFNNELSVETGDKISATLFASLTAIKKGPLDSEIYRMINKKDEIDPMALLALDRPKWLENHRSCVYEYLAWKLQYDNADSFKNMSYIDIEKMIDFLISDEDKKGEAKNNRLLKLLREMRSFFADEIGKLEYDLFIENNLNKLIVRNQEERVSLQVRIGVLLGILAEEKGALDSIAHVLQKKLKLPTT